MYKIIQVLLLLSFFITACDSPALIEVKNECNQTLIIAYNFKDSNQPQKIEIPPKEKRDIVLGFDTRWNDNFLTKYPLKVVDTIYLKLNDKEYYCYSDTCKKELFNKTNRKSKRKLQITINSDVITTSFKEN